MKITDSIRYVGVDDTDLDLFESQYAVPEGVTYNSYLIEDEKITIMDAVDCRRCEEWLANLNEALDGRTPHYLVVQHMEPDHGGSIAAAVERWPQLQLVASAKAVQMLPQFFAHIDFTGRTVTVKEGDTLPLGRHTLQFVMAPMVHWPEVMVTYEQTERVFFSADAFGTFGALNGDLADLRAWPDEARRYYYNICGKYGQPVQALLKKADMLDIATICPLHGPVLTEDLGRYIGLYDKWSRYEPEEKGVLIAYASMYGNTEAAAQALAGKLCEKGVTNVTVCDVSNTHVSYLISEAWKYSHIVLASVTYNLGIYPVMHNFLMDMKALNLQNRTFALIENGSWASKSGDLMQKFINEQLKNMTVLNERLSIASSMGADKAAELEVLADAIVESVQSV